MLLLLEADGAAGAGRWDKGDGVILGKLSVVSNGIGLLALFVIAAATMPVAILLIVIGHTALFASERWHLAAKRLETAIDAWRRDARAMGLLP